MRQSENINELLAELVELQSEMPTMPKSSQAYGYKYADLDTIVTAIKPLMHKHGLGYMQGIGGVKDGETTITTRIFNKSGQYVEDTAALPVINSMKNNAAQTLGMSITYMRRYALCAMLGITSDEDTDANLNAPAPRQAPKPQEQKPQLKGGDATDAEKKRINELLSAKYDSGTAVFTREEKLLYSDYRKDRYTAAELIAFIENALRNRRSDAPELAEVF
ncbi:MAG: ERF family protein [Ruminiclostridium sp.]|nr:ERF family protein [Ruminiclostridium sp.]